MKKIIILAAALMLSGCATSKHNVIWFQDWQRDLDKRGIEGQMEIGWREDFVLVCRFKVRKKLPPAPVPVQPEKKEEKPEKKQPKKKRWWKKW